MIAKTLGIFKIKMKVKTQRYDLKGSKRNRYITKKSANEVTLDNNFL